MVRHQMLIAKQRDAGNGMHVHAMQESNELWQIADIWMVNLWRQGMIERHAGPAIAIFNVKDYRVAAQVVPALDKPYPMLAARHQASKINRPDLLIPRHQDRMLDPWGGIILRNNQLLPWLHRARDKMIGLARRRFQFRQRHVRRMGQILL